MSEVITKPWGTYQVLDFDHACRYQIKRLDINPGSRTSLQSHKHRYEHLTVVQGEIQVISTNPDYDDMRPKRRSSGESIFIQKGYKHRIINVGVIPATIIEIQTGEYLGEDDITRYEDDYGR